MYLVTALFIAFDFLTGFIMGLATTGFNSTIMRQGLFHKLALVMVMAFGGLCDYGQQFVDIGINVPVAPAFCAYIVLMEIGSIIENIGKINPEIVIPSIRSRFEKLK